ncbi:MAG TPA: hypothetical protein VLK65_13265, partial [Vicinamibacteria bacterium]|nr:hypothetical protein [Vicinamibacteria bacterium]
MFESFAFASGYTDGIVCAESAPCPRQRERDALVDYELLSLQQAKHAMAEQLLSVPMIEIGHGRPLPGGIPTAPRTKSMDMRTKSSRFSESLHDGDHAWAK